jgi:hypothetical protein
MKRIIPLLALAALTGCAAQPAAPITVTPAVYPSPREEECIHHFALVAAVVKVSTPLIAACVNGREASCGHFARIAEQFDLEQSIAVAAECLKTGDIDPRHPAARAATQLLPEFNRQLKRLNREMKNA